MVSVALTLDLALALGGFCTSVTKVLVGRYSEADCLRICSKESTESFVASADVRRKILPKESPGKFQMQLTPIAAPSSDLADAMESLKKLADDEENKPGRSDSPPPKPVNTLPTSGGGVFFKLDSYQDLAPNSPSNPWAAETPKLKATATAPSNSLAVISRTAKIFTLGKEKTIDSALPPKLKTVDLPLGLSKLQLLRIATSAFGAIAIAEDGSLVYWTRDSKLDKFSEGGPVPGFMGSVIVDIAAGHDHFLALTMDGFLYAWGANQYNQCSPDPAIRIHTPVKVTSKLIIACAAGGHSSMCIDGHGVVYTWGRASTSLTVPITSPLIMDANKPSQSSSAPSSTGALKPATTVRPSTKLIHRTIVVDLLAHGADMSSSRQDPRCVSELTSIWLPEDLSFTQASMSSTMSVLVARDGSVWAWGDANATCGTNVDSVSLTPVRIPFPKGVRIVRALAGDIHALALDTTGKLWSWGQRFVGGRLCKDASSSPAPVPIALNSSSNASSQEVVIDFGISEKESCAITASSEVYVWSSFGSYEKIETLGNDNAPVGVSHGPSCASTYFLLGSAVGTTKVPSHQASQIYSMEDEDGYYAETADEDETA